MEEDSMAVPSFAREATGLVRSIDIPVMFMFQMSGLVPCFMLIWAYTDISYFYPGSNMMLAFLIVAVTSIPTVGITQTLMAIAFPRSGGDYNWMSRVLHPALGFAAAVQYQMASPSTVGMFTGVLSSFILVAVVAPIGLMTNNPGLIALSTTLANPYVIFAAGCIITLAVTVLMIAPLKAFAVYQYVGFIASIIGIGIFFYLLAVNTPSTFAAGFNKYSSIPFDQIVATATREGASIPTGYTLGGTLLALPYVMWWATSYWNIYPAGEAKNPTKSMPISGLGGMALFFAILIIGGLLYFNTIPYNFTYSMTWLTYQKPDVYPLPANLYPSPQLLAAFLTNNVWLVGAMAILFFFGFIYVWPGWWMLFSRSVLAYSFDRILPAKLSEVNERTHTPIWAVLLHTVLAFIFIYLCVLTPYFWAVTHYTLWSCAVGFIPSFVAAALFPYRKKEWFAAAPKIVQSKIGGIPVVTISGLAAAALMAYQVISTFIVDIIMPEGQVGILITVISWAACFVIYYASKYYHSAKGIDITKAFKEIPPE
jgi:APA family basic amino acid/polyamine antiporter